MNPCPQCGMPIVWSNDKGRYWCAIYGSHAQPTPTTHGQYCICLKCRPIGERRRRNAA